MAGIRIRWRGVARVAAIVLVALIALRLLPGVLRTPEPPPLAADVGLPQAAPEPEARRGEAAKPVTDVAGDGAAKRPHKRRRQSRAHKPRPVPDAPASTAAIGSRRRHRVPQERPRSHPAEDAESTARPTPEYVPPPAPEPVAEPLPEPPPAPSSTPGDGSEEFAPH